MLPWIFVVLIFLNASLFFWGYQREKSLEPKLPPLPAGQYEIRLLSAPQPDGGGADVGGNPARSVAEGEAAVGSVTVMDSENVESGATDEPGWRGESAPGTTDAPASSPDGDPVEPEEGIASPSTS